MPDWLLHPDGLVLVVLVVVAFWAPLLIAALLRRRRPVELPEPEYLPDPRRELERDRQARDALMASVKPEEAEPQ